MKRAVAEFVTRAWYQGARWLYLLFPLSLMYALVILVRRVCYHIRIFKTYRASVPVVVVGNITVGGTGKSPLVGYLIESLRTLGFQPGIVSRGYGSTLPTGEVREVLATSAVRDVGDEPLMLKRRLGCPVFVSSSRQLAVKALVESGCDIVIADDGLQHYALARDVEICVFDGARKWGNGFLLPMGPLREPLSRVRSTDFVVVNCANEQQNSLFVNSFRMDLQADQLHKLKSNECIPLSHFANKKVNAVAAIGNPERFFSTLEASGLDVERHSFEDHHPYSKEDLNFQNEYPIVMTEKDAVKCQHLNLKEAWYLPVSAKLSGDLTTQVVNNLKLKGWLNG